jgi:hypothetical protein
MPEPTQVQVNLKLPRRLSQMPGIFLATFLSRQTQWVLEEEGGIWGSDDDMIDAQLTTEIFGLFAPARTDIALKMAHLPIRTTARENAVWASEFYVAMYSLASAVVRGVE